MATDNLPELPPATTGLERFAAAWVERWLTNGGSVAVDGNGKAWFFARANANDVPGYEPPPANWPEFLRADRIRFDDMILTGRTSELMDLLDIVTGGRESVKEYVRRFPTHAYADGRKDAA